MNGNRPGGGEMSGLELLRFQRSCEASGFSDQADRVREARELFRNFHEQLGSSFASSFADRIFESQLRAGSHLCAALMLIPDNAKLLLFRSRADIHHATIGLHGSPEDLTASADTFAMALLAAYSCALADAWARERGHK